MKLSTFHIQTYTFKFMIQLLTVLRSSDFLHLSPRKWRTKIYLKNIPAGKFKRVFFSRIQRRS